MVGWYSSLYTLVLSSFSYLARAWSIFFVCGHVQVRVVGGVKKCVRGDRSSSNIYISGTYSTTLLPGR